MFEVASETFGHNYCLRVRVCKSSFSLIWHYNQTNRVVSHSNLLCFYSKGLKASLERLQLDYVDVVFANRPDPNTPMEGNPSVFLPYVFIAMNY